MADATMNIEGDLRQLPLPHVLQSIAAHDASGILTVQGEDDIVAVSFLNGAVVAADALNQMLEDGLGEVLQSQNLISAGDFEAVARDYEGGSSGSLGDLLVQRGLVSRGDLLEGLRLQTYRLMLQVLTWQQGEFRFYSGDEVSYEEGFKPLPVEELLIRAIEELGERGGIQGAIPKLDALYRQVPPAGELRVLGSDGDGTGNALWVTPAQSELMARMDGQTSAVAAARELGLDRYQAAYALHRLVHQDLLEYRGEATQPSPAVRPVASKRRPQPASAPPAPGAPPESPPPPLRAEVFTPPPPGAAPAHRADVGLGVEDEAPSHPAIRGPSVVQRWVGPGLGALLTLVLALTLAFRPEAYLLPFPWQDTQRGTVERQLRQALFTKIDRAAKAYFLVQAHYPDALQELVDLGLLSPADLRDPAGHTLAYSTDEVSYRIDVVEDGEPIEGLGSTEAITGDFLLDPQWLRSGGAEEEPLVLLD